MLLCLVEFEVRKNLQEDGEKLNGIYAGNPKRATAKPTTEMMLRVFRGISLSIVNIDGQDRSYMTALSPVQVRILTLLGFPLAIYHRLTVQSDELVPRPLNN